MKEKILQSVKKIIGIASNNTDFDIDLLMHINTVIFILKQMGIVKNDEFYIDHNSTWESILTSDQFNLYAIKSWTALKVRMLFDPPTSSVLADAINTNLKELEWRIYITENYIGEI